MERVNHYLNDAQMRMIKHVMSGRLTKDEEPLYKGKDYHQVLAEIAEAAGLPKPTKRWELDMNSGQLISV